MVSIRNKESRIQQLESLCQDVETVTTSTASILTSCSNAKELYQSVLEKFESKILDYNQIKDILDLIESVVESTLSFVENEDVKVTKEIPMTVDIADRQALLEELKVRNDIFI